MAVHLSRMKLVSVVAGIMAIAMLGGNAYSGIGSGPDSLPNPYGPAEAFGQLPGGRTLGSTSAISLDSQGHVWIGDRCGKNSCAGSTLDPILEFDSSGKLLLKSFGAGLFVMPHAIHFDNTGNLWVTDYEARDGKGSQAIKFTPDGKILMTLGKAGVSADGPDTFGEPNDVVEAANGDLFVADGHTPHKGSARIIKFTKDGKFIKQWGGLGSEPGQFDVPHALAFDSQGRLFVADRANKRIQIFDQEGNVLAQWRQFGSPSGIFIDRNDVIYVCDSQSEPTDSTADRYNPGFEHGVRIGNAKDGKVTAYIPMPPPVNKHNAPEGIAADAMGNVYIAETILKGVWKYTKEQGQGQ
jgi:sugar lactone lactonase YvrE